MYFPEDMTFQYFFFATYPGYFLQALPIALLVGAGYGLIRFRGDRKTPTGRKVFACAFVCYLTGLFCLVIALDLMGMMYYRLFYHRASMRTIRWFSGAIKLLPDFSGRLGSEQIGNFLMFLPFGVLHPLAQERPAWRKTVGTGLLTVLVIETLQPIFGRAFDDSDIVCNALGVLVSATLFMGARRLIRRQVR